jgi:hypothetical protein
LYVFYFPVYILPSMTLWFDCVIYPVYHWLKERTSFDEINSRDAVGVNPFLVPDPLCTHKPMQSFRRQTALKQPYSRMSFGTGPIGKDADLSVGDFVSVADKSLGPASDIVRTLHRGGSPVWPRQTDVPRIVVPPSPLPYIAHYEPVRQARVSQGRLVYCRYFSLCRFEC